MKKWRLTILSIGFGGAYLFLIFNLFNLQINKNAVYITKAQNQEMASGLLSSNRGNIYFSDKNSSLVPAVLNKDYSLIYAVPKEIKDPIMAAASLSNILNISAADLEKKFDDPKNQYSLLLYKASDSQVSDVENLKITGIYIRTQTGRYYPYGSLASQVLGFISQANQTESADQAVNMVGRYGIEKFFNSQLSGINGVAQDGKITPPSDGSDVALTIDPNIQIEAEKILNDLVAANGATGGSVIVADPKTGKILAMGGNPSFNPNNYGSSPLANFLNTDVQSVYESGSIMKVITMAAGIDSGKVTPDTTYNDKGYININKAHLTNYDLTTHGAYGSGITMTQVIEHSINTGAIFVENQTGNDIFLSYLKKFGFNQKTGIDLPGEVSGNIGQLTSKAPQVNWDTAAYGQGIAVSPIGLVTAISAIANKGVMMRPYINAASQPQEIRRVISTSTASQVVQMMVNAVDLAQVANINGYTLAGKTGSAYIPNPNGGGYLNKLIDSYIGFGPTSDPHFVAFIRLNTIPVTALAAETVVPAWQQLARFIINYYNIPPDRTTNNVIPNCPNLICP